MSQKELKIFITKFIHDELEFVGPDISRPKVLH
jgi:hypothetical protein